MRPQKKRQQAQQQTMNSLGPGSRVMTGSGMFGTVVSIGEKQAVIEVSPGVELTVLKQAISRVSSLRRPTRTRRRDDDDDEARTPTSPDIAFGSTGAGWCAVRAGHADARHVGLGTDSSSTPTRTDPTGWQLKAAIPVAS